MAGSGMNSSGIELPHCVVLLESATIDDPVTVGVFHPAIILPSKDQDDRSRKVRLCFS
jgi:beta-lactamase regulating signal transducer with metallopeptidase domain